MTWSSCDRVSFPQIFGHTETRGHVDWNEGFAPVVHVGQELHFGFDGGDLLGRARLGTSETKERHFG